MQAAPTTLESIPRLIRMTNPKLKPKPTANMECVQGPLFAYYVHIRMHTQTERWTHMHINEFPTYGQTNKHLHTHTHTHTHNWRHTLTHLRQTDTYIHTTSRQMETHMPTPLERHRNSYTRYTCMHT